MHPSRWAIVVAFGLAVGSGSAQERPATRAFPAKPEPGEMDRNEEQAVRQAAERAMKSAETDRGRWLLEMEKAFPVRTAAGRSEDECGRWFTLLSGGGREWRRDDAPTRGLAELFDRVTQALELGPVPTIRRDEFQRYVKEFVFAESKGQEKPADRSAATDLAFRMLDRDGSGVLEPDEQTDRLRAAKGIDADGDGLITRDEYRVYFQARLATAIELATRRQAAEATKASAGSAERPKPAARVAVGKRPSGLPRWFEQLDLDGDGQIGLYEWRQAGLPTNHFRDLDLDGDGLLTAAEYLRYVKLHPEGVPVELKPVKVKR
jgi:hypothetical protein